MLDVNIIIPPMVEDITRLEPQFPDIAARFPLGILTALDGGAGVVLSGEERLAAVSFQIDLYDVDLRRCTQTAAALSARLTARGFRRTAGAALREQGLYRRTLSFAALIDEHTGMIYRRDTWST